MTNDSAAATESLLAGVAKVDITGAAGDRVEDPLYRGIDAGVADARLYAKALVMRDGAATVVLITVDAVAIAEIGTIPDGYLAQVRSQLHAELAIEPSHVVISASHCHGVVCADVAERTVQAVRSAWQGMVPVEAGVGLGREDRIVENRRLRLADGRFADVRRAYSLPPDDEIEAVGPIDPEIGILRLDRLDDPGSRDGRTLAVLFNFACHPIQGVPSGANTADISGYACEVIEDSVGGGAVALFVQGCAADINPIQYRDVDNPPDAETLGNRLGLSVLRGLREVQTRPGATVGFTHGRVELPRADLSGRIASLESEQTELVSSLKGTSLNLKTFMALAVKHGLSPEYPSYDAHRYLHEEAMGRGDLRRLDALNRQGMTDYLHNIQAMEQLTRIETNLGLLRMHRAANSAARETTIDVEVVGLRVGDFVLVTFPGELSVETGLQIKERSPHRHTFVAGISNGYIYYTPTAEQLANPGSAQEDCDCRVAPEWEALFLSAVSEILTVL